MIFQENQSYLLNTKHTSYAFHVLESGHLEHLHYGKKIHLDTLSMMEKNCFVPGCSIQYDKAYPDICLESLCLEMSSLSKGDNRRPFIEIEMNGHRSSDFIFYSSYQTKGKDELDTLPSSYDANNEVDHLCITLKDRHTDVFLEMHYFVFEKEDVISKQVKLINKTKSSIFCHKLMSNQIDFQPDAYVLTTFTGAWAREMKKNEIPVHTGVIENGSIYGYSSNHANPFVMLSNPDTNEDHGSCYGMNLIYSGNHIETIEKGAYQKVRFLQGIHPTNFTFEIKVDEVFEVPEAIMSYSANGFNQLSHQFHEFIQSHIVRGPWAKKERPVLLNSWEAAYFDINEKKLVNLAKSAKEVGVELFVMDDGWFSNRSDDARGLGDWSVNKKKFPNGLDGLSKKIHDLDLLFGIWVEPEMVNVNSQLYKKHPEWVLENPTRNHSEGRNQRILDLSHPEVQSYIIDTMSDVFHQSNCDYVKWDLNRVVSDVYSSYQTRQSETLHRNVLGFYSIMKELTNRFPNILFEGCASGGNRFDLGILCYFPQIWTSDDTDALVRCEIQNNASYGYPLSVMGAHVSGVPNHQTLRLTDLSTRFNVACFGILGYEFNLLDLSEDQIEDIKKQIEFYKQNRSIFQYGQFYRIRSFKDGYNGTLEASLSNIMEWSVVNSKQTKAHSFIFQKHVIPNTQFERVMPKGLHEEYKYHFTSEPFKLNIVKFGDLINTQTPIHIKQDSSLHRLISHYVKMNGEVEDYTVYGDTLMNHGVCLKQGFAGLGFNEQIRYFQDTASRLYKIEKCE